MNVKLVITRQDPAGKTEIDLPPSNEVNRLLARMHTFFDEQFCKGLDEIEAAAREGDLGEVSAKLAVATKMNTLAGALELAHDRYEILLNANPREEPTS